jgi:hypothetical protein
MREAPQGLGSREYTPKGKAPGTYVLAD